MVEVTLLNDAHIGNRSCKKGDKVEVDAYDLSQLVRLGAAEAPEAPVAAAAPAQTQSQQGSIRK